MTSELMAKVIDKLRKLRAHMESAAKMGSMAEAEAFAARLAQMQQEYKIEAAQLDVAEAPKDDVAREDISAADMGVNQAGEKWLAMLCAIVANAHYCRGFVYAGHREFMFAGRDTDRPVAIFVFTMLARWAQKTCESDRRAARRRGDIGHNYVGNWWAAFNAVIRRRYEEQRREAQQTYAGNTQALAVINEGLTVVDRWLADKVKAQSSKMTMPRANYAATVAGAAAGQRANLNVHAVGAGKPGKALPVLKS